MTQIQQRPNEYPAELVNAPTPQRVPQDTRSIIVEQPTIVYRQHWLAAVERLHPAAQVAVAVALGFGLPVALGYMATGLATFALALLALLSQFILAIGAGVGIIVLVVVGVTAISKL